jgi:multisubunit Na+/H+ antiporter MnhE subunit
MTGRSTHINPVSFLCGIFVGAGLTLLLFNPIAADDDYLLWGILFCALAGIIFAVSCLVEAILHLASPVTSPPARTTSAPASPSCTSVRTEHVVGYTLTNDSQSL